MTTTKEQRRLRQEERAVERIFYGHLQQPGSLAGSAKVLKRYVPPNVTQKVVRRFLPGQDAYTMHRPTRHRFERRRTYSKGIDDLFQADICDMTNVTSHNNSYRYMLTCIDVFSKFSWVVPLRTKSGREVTEAFESRILSNRKCRMLQTDKGTEFLNNACQSMLARNNIHFYTSENDDIKAAVVERFNRTLKERIYRYFTRSNTRRYLDVIDDIVHSYNNTYHRSIGMAPSQVDADNEDDVRKRLYPPKPKKFVWKLNVGDTVRISVRRRVFRKAYVGNWSEELFTVSARHATQPVTYAVIDTTEEPIKGRFYEQELQKLTKPTDDHYYAIEKILKTRRRNTDGRREYYVRWRGYPKSFDSWTDVVKALDLVHHQRQHRRRRRRRS